MQMVQEIYFILIIITEFYSLENMLQHLKKNIRYENEMKPKLDTVEEFCKEFGFEVYERLY